jgi:beta-lactamase class D
MAGGPPLDESRGFRHNVCLSLATPFKASGELLVRKFLVLILALCFGVVGTLVADDPSTSTPIKKRKTPIKATPKAIAARTRAGAKLVKASFVPTAATSKTSTAKAAAGGKSVGRGPWRAPNYADSTDGDNVDGDDLVVRRAAVEALGPLNGAVVVSDATTGRILSIVNQKLAYQSGFQPCSTVKVPVALAALSESLVERNTPIRVYGRTTFDLTTALAKSNNQYFASLGEKLGFERMSYYARLFGFGEKAGLDIAGEQAGILPSETPKSGMGMMTSFGDGITFTPLELAALMGAVANGGTLYYLQYPHALADAERILPRVKRRLDIEQWIPEIKPGMMGAVEYGTARRIGFDASDPIYGKTGTCTDTRTPTHLGWFGSFGEIGKDRLVVVVLLTGGRVVSGPAASGVAGNVYKNLIAQNYAIDGPAKTTTTATNSPSEPGSSAR